MSDILSLHVTLLLVVSALGVGCSEDSSSGSADPWPTPAAVEAGARTELRWRRFRPLLAGYARALELDPSELCEDADGSPCAVTGPVKLTDYLIRHQGVARDDAEAACATLQGTTECADDDFITEYTPQGVHVFSLGGNEPFLGRFAPLAEPSLLTPLVLDRVALLACGRRVERDSEGTPRVFQSLDLSLEQVTPATPGMREMVEDLYRRLLARQATREEIDIVLAVTETQPPPSAQEAARLACFIIATTTEELFQ